MNSPSEFRWIAEKVVLAIHVEEISHQGGLAGIRDESLLESALARPKNLKFYENASLERCAAAYIYGIVNNHPFLDGNKRTGFLTGITFLMLNGYYINAQEIDVVITIMNVAAGNMTEDELTSWLKVHLIKM